MKRSPTAVSMGSPIVLYDYRPTHGGEHPQIFLNGFSGYLHVDG
nr:transposase [Paenibacillus harenae]